MFSPDVVYITSPFFSLLLDCEEKFTFTYKFERFIKHKKSRNIREMF